MGVVMETVDGRKLSREALHERHRLIMRAFKRGQSKAAISRELGSVTRRSARRSGAASATVWDRWLPSHVAGARAAAGD